MKFSVTIPAYKCRFLAEAIESVLQQTYRDFELIIVDDCSPEDIFSVVSKYTDERIHYYRNKKNCGAINVVDNWNICLNYCTGDYVICMGDDDRLLPCCLEEYKKLIEKYSGLDVYHAWTEIIDEKSIVYSIQEARPEWESAYSLIWHRWNSRKYQFIGDFLYSVNHLRQNGGYFNMPLAWGSDDISAARAALNGGIANTQIPCFQYRFNRYSITGSGNYLRKIESILLEKKWYVDMLSNRPNSGLDVLYYSMMNHQIDERFTKKIKALIRVDMCNHIYRLFYWLKVADKTNLTRMQILRIFISAFQLKLMLATK